MKSKSILVKINILSFLLVVFSFLLTIFQVGFFTKEIYFLNQAKEEITKLSRENQNLEDQLLSLNFFSKLEEFLKKENFVRAKNLKYIQIFEGAALAK